MRPTTARAREALFNIIGSIHGMDVLDCFSGSGIIALEALSRGARSAVSIERDRRATAALHQVRDQWQLADRWEIVTGDLARALSRVAGRHFGLIFADPPYRSDWPQRLPSLLLHHRIRADLLVIEEASASPPAWPEAVQTSETRRYGESALHFVQLRTFAKEDTTP